MLSGLGAADMTCHTINLIPSQPFLGESQVGCIQMEDCCYRSWKAPNSLADDAARKFISNVDKGKKILAENPQLPEHASKK